jgi:regulator of protease activity HflC (stomatin/prohibitin superfamily)
MKHVLPLKEKEIEQRRLEAEARKVQKTKDAEGDAEARKIESSAEADARRKLSDADAYRIEVTGKAQSEQMARDSLLIAKNPLLIQKTLADKLSDKIQVIVAPPAAGGFFAGGLIGTQPRGQVTAAVNTKTAPANDNGGE